jgi:hypothetical protein
MSIAEEHPAVILYVKYKIVIYYNNYPQEKNTRKRRRGQGLRMRIDVKPRRISIMGEENYDDSGTEDEEEDVGKYCMNLSKRN